MNVLELKSATPKNKERQGKHTIYNDNDQTEIKGGGKRKLHNEEEKTAQGNDSFKQVYGASRR